MGISWEVLRSRAGASRPFHRWPAIAGQSRVLSESHSSTRDLQREVNWLLRSFWWPALLFPPGWPWIDSVLVDISFRVPKTRRLEDYCQGPFQSQNFTYLSARSTLCDKIKYGPVVKNVLLKILDKKIKLNPIELNIYITILNSFFIHSSLLCLPFWKWSFHNTDNIVNRRISN